MTHITEDTLPKSVYFIILLAIVFWVSSCNQVNATFKGAYGLKSCVDIYYKRANSLYQDGEVCKETTFPDVHYCYRKVHNQLGFTIDCKVYDQYKDNEKNWDKIKWEGNG